MRPAFVLTVSDGVAAGTRDDESGRTISGWLRDSGFAVTGRVVPDDQDQVASAVASAIDGGARLVVTTGGTGLGPRDRTPEAIQRVIDYEIPGFGEVMRHEGRRSTPLAAISRSLAGVRGSALVIVVPGSPRGALESLAAVSPLLEHALEILAGRTASHPLPTGADAARAPGADAGGTKTGMP